MPVDEFVSERRRKVEQLAALGVPAYNVDFRPDHTLAEALARLDRWEASGPAAGEEGPSVRVAGRIMQLRLQGRSCFAHIEGGDDRLQVWFRADVVGEQGFGLVRLLDLGDIVGVEGALMRTRRGEPTVEARDLTLLVKSLRPLPEKYHGLQDQETRYRHRHLDLVSSREARRRFAGRSRMIGAVRRALAERDFLEVETPVLHGIRGGAEAQPFLAHWNSLHTDVYLRVELELHLKRLLVGGYPRVYEIGRCFRNEGLSPRHNPEFTMLEAYQAYADYSDMRHLTEALVVAAARAVAEGVGEGGPRLDGDRISVMQGDRAVDLTPPFRTARMNDLIREYCDIDCQQEWDHLEQRATAAGVELVAGMRPGEVMLEIYEQRVEPLLWEPTFVLDYPRDVSPLARRRADDDRFVERFELVVCGRELANAFSELNDPIDQRERFELQARLHQERHPEDTSQRLDEDFLQAIELGMPPAGGMGMGMDRLAMLLLGAAAIRDVLLFPMMRPRSDEPGT